jgi:ABC-2 type transport system permease protein
MKLLQDLKLLYTRTLTQTLRNMMWVIVGISTPILYLALFTPLLKNLAGGPGFPTGSVLDIFLPGILALMAFGAGISAGFSTIFELQGGMVERLRVTPTSRLALLMGPILASITTSFVFMAMVVGIGLILGFHLHLAGLLIAFILLALLQMIFAAFSISMALLTKEISGFAAIINGLNLPLLLLAGVLLPLSLAPTWMRDIAHIDPLYYVVEANRVLATGVIRDGKVLMAFIFMAALTVLTLWWATRVYRKAVA